MPEAPSPASRSRATEYLLPLLVIAAVAAGIWWTIDRAVRRNADRETRERRRETAPFLNPQRKIPEVRPIP